MLGNFAHYAGQHQQGAGGAVGAQTSAFGTSSAVHGSSPFAQGQGGFNQQAFGQHRAVGQAGGGGGGGGLGFGVFGSSAPAAVPPPQQQQQQPQQQQQQAAGGLAGAGAAGSGAQQGFGVSSVATGAKSAAAVAAAAAVQQHQQQAAAAHGLSAAGGGLSGLGVQSGTAGGSTAAKTTMSSGATGPGTVGGAAASTGGAAGAASTGAAGSGGAAGAATIAPRRPVRLEHGWLHGGGELPSDARMLADVLKDLWRVDLKLHVCLGLCEGLDCLHNTSARDSALPGALGLESVRLLSPEQETILVPTPADAQAPDPCKYTCWESMVTDQFEEASDVYAMGIIILEVLSGGRVSPQDVVDLSRAGRPSAAFLDLVDASLTPAVQKAVACLGPKAERPQAGALMQFFKSFQTNYNPAAGTRCNSGYTRPATAGPAFGAKAAAEPPAAASGQPRWSEPVAGSQPQQQQQGGGARPLAQFSTGAASTGIEGETSRPAQSMSRLSSAMGAPPVPDDERRDEPAPPRKQPTPGSAVADQLSYAGVVGGGRSPPPPPKTSGKRNGAVSPPEKATGGAGGVPAPRSKAKPEEEKPNALPVPKSNAAPALPAPRGTTAAAASKSPAQPQPTQPPKPLSHQKPTQPAGHQSQAPNRAGQQQQTDPRAPAISGPAARDLRDQRERELRRQANHQGNGFASTAQAPRGTAAGGGKDRVGFGNDWMHPGSGMSARFGGASTGGPRRK